MTAVRKIVDSDALVGLFDLPPAFKDRKIEVVLSLVDDPSSRPNNFPSFTMSQIEEWAKTPEIQNLVGALNGANLPPDIRISDIRDMRLSEKYTV